MGVYFKSTFLFEANTNAAAASEISVIFIFCLFHLKPHVWPLFEDLTPNVKSSNRKSDKTVKWSLLPESCEILNTKEFLYT